MDDSKFNSKKKKVGDRVRLCKGWNMGEIPCLYPGNVYTVVKSRAYSLSLDICESVKAGQPCQRRDCRLTDGYWNSEIFEVVTDEIIVLSANEAKEAIVLDYGILNQAEGFFR